MSTPQILAQIAKARQEASDIIEDVPESERDSVRAAMDNVYACLTALEAAIHSPDTLVPVNQGVESSHNSSQLYVEVAKVALDRFKEEMVY